MVTNLEPGTVLGSAVVRGPLFPATAFDAYQGSLQDSGEPVCILCSAIDPQSLTSFNLEEEIAAARAVEDPAFPRILSGGESEGLRWIITEPVGKPVWTPAHKRRDWLEIVSIAFKLGEALALAASKKVFHGAIEPACVRATPEGGVQLVGLNAARIFGLDLAMVKRSPRYFAPEQLKHDPVPTDPQPDIYALGLLLFAALLGREPFKGAVGPRLEAMVLKGRLDRTRDSDVPPVFFKWFTGATARDPRQRFRDWAIVIKGIAGVAIQGVNREAQGSSMEDVFREKVMALSPDSLKRVAAGVAEKHGPGAPIDENSSPESVRRYLLSNLLQDPEDSSRPRELLAGSTPAPPADSRPLEGSDVDSSPATPRRVPDVLGAAGAGSLPSTPGAHPAPREIPEPAPTTLRAPTSDRRGWSLHASKLPSLRSRALRIAACGLLLLVGGVLAARDFVRERRSVPELALVPTFVVLAPTHAPAPIQVPAPSVPIVSVPPLAPQSPSIVPKPRSMAPNLTAEAERAARWARACEVFDCNR